MKREYPAGLIAAAVIGMGVAAATGVPFFQVAGPASASTRSLSATDTFTDFGLRKDGRKVGRVLPPGGLTGRGAASTILRMTDRTSTRAGEVPTADDATNPIDLMLVTGAAPVLRGFTLQGSPQGHLYNGLRITHTRGARITDVKVAAVPGDFYTGPGETFGISDWRGRDNVYTDVEVDGAGVGAAGIGIDSSADVTVNRAHLHDNPFSAGIAVRRTTGATLTDVRTVRNRTGITLEQTGGAVLITRPIFQDNLAQDLLVATDIESTKVTIADPVLAIGAKLRVFLPATQLDRPNKQLRSDITVTRNGVDVTAGVIHWL